MALNDVHLEESALKVCSSIYFALKEEQKENRRLCGRSYIKDYVDYVCVNEIGDLIKPHYVTESFPKLLKANGLRPVRYHDLRHSCASLLLANGVPMKQI